MMDRTLVPSGIRGVSRQLPRLGKIRLGVQEPNRRGGGTHPVATDYFVTDDDAAGAQLRELLGTDRPTEIPIQFPTDRVDDVCRHNFERWRAGGLSCRGNGDRAIAQVDAAAFERWQAEGDPEQPPPLDVWASTRHDDQAPDRRVLPCFGAGFDGRLPCPHYASGDCGPSLHLSFLVRGFRGLGVWQLDTGSVIGIGRILSFLDLLTAATGGHPAFVPLRLSLDPVVIRGRTHHVARLDCDLSLPELQAMGDTSSGGPLALAAPTPALEGPALDATDRGVEPLPDEAPSDVVGPSTEPAPGELAGGPPVSRSGPLPPRARTVEDTRLGAFENVGHFYSKAFRELRLAGPRVRELAGVAAGAAPETILDYEGEAGAGLDALWVELAVQVAGVGTEAAR